jgi:hypothetical protein
MTTLENTKTLEWEELLPYLMLMYNMHVHKRVALHFVPFHFVPGHFVPVISSWSFRPLIHFVPGHFVPGHFVPWSFHPLELNLQKFMPRERDLFKM